MRTKTSDGSQLDALLSYYECKDAASVFAAECADDSSRELIARSFCAQILFTFWTDQNRGTETDLAIALCPVTTHPLTTAAAELAKKIGTLVSSLPAEDAGFLIGSVYTAMLPNSVRARLGAYYTPPPLVSCLLDMAERAGVDFATSSVLDPACGGGAFLAPVALRMVAALAQRNASPAETMDAIQYRLQGAELDPFAAWMTEVILDASLKPLYLTTGRRLTPIIRVTNTLQTDFGRTFDLVIGNPPYGRVTLDADLRAMYADSLFGQEASI